MWSPALLTTGRGGGALSSEPSQQAHAPRQPTLPPLTTMAGGSTTSDLAPIAQDASWLTVVTVPQGVLPVPEDETENEAARGQTVMVEI